MARALLQARTDRGLARERNEDEAAALVLPGGWRLLAVADGLGGHPGGEVASRTAIGALAARLRAAPPGPGRDPATVLRDAFGEANRRVRALRRGPRARMATTLAAALARGERAWVAHLGDSRAYLAAGGEARRLTADHSWVEERVRAGLLAPDDPLAAARRHLITRAIGLEERAAADLRGPIALPGRCVLLLCSDGLHGAISAGAIVRALAGADGDPAGALIAAALSAGGPDNVAVALLVRGGGAWRGPGAYARGGLATWTPPSTGSATPVT